MEAKGQLKKRIAKFLFVYLMIVSMVVLSSTAYAQISWLAYDDFASEAKSVKLWNLSNNNMCPYYLPDFLGGKMIEEAFVGWFEYSCSPNQYNQNRVRTMASPTVVPYINGLAATVKITEFVNYYFGPICMPPEPPNNCNVNQNNVRARLAAIFFNDTKYENYGGGDLKSDIWASIEVRDGNVGWTVLRFKDSVGYAVEILGSGPLLQPWNLYDQDVRNFVGIPLDLKLWFDGKRIYFSVQVRKYDQDIIEVTATYTPDPGLPVLPPKSSPSPMRRIETLVDVSYLMPNQPIYPPIDPYGGEHWDDSSRIKAEWDNVSVAVNSANLTTVKRIIRDASR